jgi:hypothetical protein
MRLAWSRPLPAPPAGLSLAREPGTLLVRDQEHHLGRYDRTGQLELRQRAPASLAASAIADDGRVVAAAGRRGQVWLLTLDFVRLWERSVPRRPVGVALDGLGSRVAVADEAGGVTVFDREGREVWRATSPRPLLHLAFVPELPVLLGSAEYGLVCAFDDKGQMLWRDGLVAHVGSLAVTGDGSRAVLACFTDGLNCYAAMSPKRTVLARAAPSRLAALDYRGEALLTTGLANELARRGPDGEVRGVLLLPSGAVALAVDALGFAAVAALSDGTLAGVEIPR